VPEEEGQELLLLLLVEEEEALEKGVGLQLQEELMVVERVCLFLSEQQEWTWLLQEAGSL